MVSHSVMEKEAFYSRFAEILYSLNLLFMGLFFNFFGFFGDMAEPTSWTRYSHFIKQLKIVQ